MVGSKLEVGVDEMNCMEIKIQKASKTRLECVTYQECHQPNVHTTA